VIYVANGAERRMLSLILALGLDAHLYTDNHVHDPLDTVGSFTELSGHGYGPIHVPPEIWVVSEGDPTRADAPEVTWIFTSAGPQADVYGVYFTWPDDGALAYAETLTGGPFRVVNVNDLIGYTPSLTLRPET
jgi:hypothetical protein